MASVTFEFAGEVATRKAGEILGELLREQPAGRRAFVLALEGELGAGKTTFIRGLAKGLGIRENITSPSFLIARRYRFSSLRGAEHSKSLSARRRGNLTGLLRGVYPEPSRGARNDGEERVIWHFDFYRFNRVVTRRDLALLNFPEILQDPRNIVAIEWAERVEGFLPREKLTLRFNVISPTRRRIAMGNA